MQSAPYDEFVRRFDQQIDLAQQVGKARHDRSAKLFFDAQDVTGGT